MTDINSVVLVGRLVKDAEVKTFDSGFAVINFTIATNRSYKKNEEWIDEASFIDCKYFSKSATKLSQYVVKGKQIAVQGQLVQESWEKDGVKKTRLVVQVDNIQLIRSKGTEQKEPTGEAENIPF